MKQLIFAVAMFSGAAALADELGATLPEQTPPKTQRLREVGVRGFAGAGSDGLPTGGSLF